MEWLGSGGRAYARVCSVAIAVVVAASSFVVGPSPAAGQTGEDVSTESDATAVGSRDAEARELFEAGTVAFEAARYDAALMRWQEAFQLSGRTELLYNIGLAHDRLRQDERAVEAFKAFLAAHPNSPKAHEVEVRVEAIEGAQATSPARAAASLTVDDGALAAPTSDDRARRDGTRWYKKWWVWTIAGVVVAGTVAAVAASQAGGETRTGAPAMPASNIDILTFRR